MYPRIRAALGVYAEDLVASFQASAFVPIRCRPLLLRLMGVRLGKGCYVNPGVGFHRANVRLGDQCVVGSRVFFDASGSVVIGNRVKIAAGCILHSATHRIMPSVYRLAIGEVDARATWIGDGCWLGTGTIVLPGVRIGDGCVIAAGAVVASDCDPNGLYAGVPARRLRELETEPSVQINGAVLGGE